MAVVFGCWTSVSRKSVLPVFEELNGLLFYPVQYEGEELSKNVFYTGAAPNQQAIPAVEYLMSKDGGGAKRWVLLGTDYVYPRTTNKILRAFLKSKGVDDKDIDEKYTPFGHSDYQTIVADIKKFSAGGKTAVVSTINGDSNVPFYKELGNQGLKATDVPVVAFSVGEEELRGVDTKPLVGHLAAWNYFMSLKNPANDEFKKKWAAYAKAKKLAGRGQAADQRSDGSDVHRHLHVEAGGREGEELRHRQGASPRWAARRSRRPTGFDVEDGCEEPPPAQAGVHRRSEGRRPVQRRVEDARARSRRSRGARYIAGNDKKKDGPEAMRSQSRPRGALARAAAVPRSCAMPTSATALPAVVCATWPAAIAPEIVRDLARTTAMLAARRSPRWSPAAIPGAAVARRRGATAKRAATRASACCMVDGDARRSMRRPVPL